MSVRTSTLDNGLRVVSDAMPRLQTASVGVWVDVGARHEAPAENGVAHLLEHMAFKGTKRRTALRIAEEIEAVGGHLNAFTGREQTAYYARVLRDDVPLAVDILADILLNATLDLSELERERDVVCQEIAQAYDTPDDIIFDHLQATAYPGQPVGRSILGTHETVGALERDHVAHFMAAHYRAPRLVLVAAGAIDHDALLAEAAQAFAKLPDGPDAETEPATWQGGDFRDGRELEQVHLTLGFNGVSFFDDDFFAYQVLATLLGGGMSSRLFQEIREKRGLAYSVFAFSSAYLDGGMFGLYAGTSAEHVAELVPVVADEMAKVGRSVEAAEIARAQAQLKAGLLMSLESSSARIEQLGRQVLIYGHPLDIGETIGRIEAVDGAAVTRAAHRLLGNGRPALAAMGPIGGLETFDRIAARFG